MVCLLNSGLPDNLLCVLEDWFSKCFTCVKWNTVHSDMFKLNCGVRQVACIFALLILYIYVDDIIESVVKKAICCVFKSVFVSIMPTILRRFVTTDS
jgi:hypothetical protein